MAWDYSNLDSFREDVASISSNVRVEQWNAAMAQWRIGELIMMPTFSEADLMSGYYKYQPQLREYFSGDPTPATCESDPQSVDMSVGDPVSTRISPWEKKYDLCHHSTMSLTLEEAVARGEKAVAMSLGSVLFNESWYGIPVTGSYGLFTHPLTSVVGTAAPVTAVPGQTNWASKAANEIYTELRNAMLGMLNPKLAISEAAWNAGADKIFGEGTQCARLADCLVRHLAESESTGSFSGQDDIFILKFLDDVLINNAPSDGVYIVWDDDAVEFPSSEIVPLTPIQNKKRVDVIRQISSAGTVIKYGNSVKVVTGINAVLP